MKKNNKDSSMLFILVVVAILVILLVVVALTTFIKPKNTDGAVTTTTTTPTTAPDPTFSTQANEEIVGQTAFLGNNLYITKIGKYSGAYMEDGSNEYVSDVMMAILENQGENDLQLARIELVYADFTANFEVTNLPAGESVVLLEKNRHAYVSDSYLQANINSETFYAEPMNLKEEQVKVTGGKREITVENISDETLGKIFVYYKSCAADQLYGGTTYRVSVEAGLEPGTSTTIHTGHYYETASTIVLVEIYPYSE